MAPKPQNRTKPTGTKVSATSKAVDDFLAQSSVPAGLIERKENEKKQKEKLADLSEKYMHLISMTSVQLNNESLNKCRVIANIFSGCSAGILGLGGGTGMLWWVGINAATSLVMYMRMLMLGSEENGESKYFKNPF